MEDDGDDFSLFSGPAKAALQAEYVQAGTLKKDGAKGNKSNAKSVAPATQKHIEPAATPNDEFGLETAGAIDEDGHSTEGRTTFARLGLASWLQKQCSIMGMPRPTEIQEKCVPHVLQGILSARCTVRIVFVFVLWSRFGTADMHVVASPLSSSAPSVYPGQPTTQLSFITLSGPPLALVVAVCTLLVLLSVNPRRLCSRSGAGRDCIGAAKTGSGKTAAFALPILQKLSEDPYGVFALVLTPTRYSTTFKLLMEFLV